MNIFDFILGDTKSLKTYDFTNQEDVAEALDILDKIKSDEEPEYKLIHSLVGDETLNIIAKAIQEKYAEAHKDDIVIGSGKPSDATSDVMKVKIKSLVDEYINDELKPQYKFTSEQVSSIKTCLYEFACWIYNR